MLQGPDTIANAFRSAILNWGPRADLLKGAVRCKEINEAIGS